MTMTYPIRTITADEFDALCEVPAQAFLETWPHEALEREQEVIEYDRTVAAFDGPLMAGSASAYSFRLTVPGGAVPAAGVTMVAVLPTHRRRGILTGLMGHLIADAQGRGEPVAILFASEAAIYGRFGFGLASMHQRLTIRRGEGKVSLGPAAPGPGPGPLRLRTAEPGHVVAELAKVYEVELAQRPGMLARDDRWWGYILSDHPAARPAGMSQLRCLIAEDDAGPRGYVLYRTQLAWGEDQLAAGILRVRELVGTDPAATAALWSDVLSRDLVGEVIAAVRPMDDPLLAMLADPRRARPAPADNLWLRLVDVPAALRERRYAAGADLVLEVIDPLIGSNDGCWRLRTGGLADGSASCERTSGPPDLRLTVQALGAAYLGGSSLSQLAAAGHVAELTPGSLATLAAAMSWARAPHCGTMF
jgi:predicted acetyltransferase